MVRRIDCTSITESSLLPSIYGEAWLILLMPKMQTNFYALVVAVLRQFQFIQYDFFNINFLAENYRPMHLPSGTV